MPVEFLDRVIEQAPDVRRNAAGTGGRAHLVRFAEAGIITVIATERVASMEAPVVRQPLVERELHRVVLTLRLRKRVLTARPGVDRARRRREAVGDDIERLRPALSGVADDVRLVVRR